MNRTTTNNRIGIICTIDGPALTEHVVLYNTIADCRTAAITEDGCTKTYPTDIDVNNLKTINNRISPFSQSKIKTADITNLGIDNTIVRPVLTADRNRLAQKADIVITCACVCPVNHNNNVAGHSGQDCLLYGIIRMVLAAVFLRVANFGIARPGVGWRIIIYVKSSRAQNRIANTILIEPYYLFIAQGAVPDGDLIDEAVESTFRYVRVPANPDLAGTGGYPSGIGHWTVRFLHAVYI